MRLDEYVSVLLARFQSLGVPEREVSHRRDAFNKAISDCRQNHISSRFYNLAHELKCLYFLGNFGNVVPALDYSHTEGCDALLNDYYQIEFVCASAGQHTDESGYDCLRVHEGTKPMTCDYAEKERFLFSRITTVLHAKRNFYEKHALKGSVSTDKPYIIFLGLGELAYEMMCGKFGIDLTGVLFGKGCPTITVNGEGEVIMHGYAHNENFQKYNGSLVDCNLFCWEEFRCVSGIIFSDADLFDEYTTKNTWLFINPFATSKIRKKDFPGLIYWSVYKSSNYIPRRKGHRL